VPHILSYMWRARGRQWINRECKPKQSLGYSSLSNMVWCDHIWSFYYVIHCFLSICKQYKPHQSLGYSSLPIMLMCDNIWSF
jgi:hypothetical protein